MAKRERSPGLAEGAAAGPACACPADAGSRADRIDLMFRAFSDRTRLRILSLLTGGETCVCDIVRVVGAPQPKVSRHLAYLRRAGLVVARRQGAWQHYSLAPATTEFHRSLLACLSCCFSAVPELTRDAARLGRDDPRGGGGCC